MWPKIIDNIEENNHYLHVFLLNFVIAFRLFSITLFVFYFNYIDF